MLFHGRHLGHVFLFAVKHFESHECMKRARQTKNITDDQCCRSVLSRTGTRGHFAHIDSFFPRYGLYLPVPYVSE